MHGKNILMPLLGASLLLLSSNTIAAVTKVDVTANIGYLDDPYNVLADLNIGQVITASYTYDDSVADSNPDPQVGHYLAPSEVGQMTLSLGNTALSTYSHTKTPDIIIDDQSWQSYEYFGVNSSAFMESNGIQLDMVAVDLLGDSGVALNGDQLVGVIPELTHFNLDKMLFISGSRFGQYFQIHAEISQLTANASPPAPQKISYKATAQVEWVDDYMGSFGNRLTMGELVTITYSYDTSTPDSDANPEFGFYQHAPGSGSIKVELPDGSSFESTMPFDVMTGNMTWNDHLTIHGGEAQSSDPILNGVYADINFFGNENAISSDSLPGTDMQLSDWFDGLFNAHSTVYGWSFSARVISLELVEPNLVVAVPGDAKIHPMQQFDAAFYVANAQPLMAISGTHNNMPIDHYLSNCDISPGGIDEQVVLCPQMHQLLMPGENSINLQFQLMDNSIIEKTVIWTLP